MFENEYRFTKKQLAEFFEVSVRYIEKFTEKNRAELVKNGYEMLTGNRLKDIKIVIRNQFDTELDFGIKTSRLSIKWWQTSFSPTAGDMLEGNHLIVIKLIFIYQFDHELKFMIKTTRLGVINFCIKLWLLPFTQDNIYLLKFEN